MAREIGSIDLHQEGLLICIKSPFAYIGKPYSPIKNRDHPAARKVIAFDRFVRYLKPPFPPEADSRYAAGQGWARK
jgi:hypothetical protein